MAAESSVLSTRGFVERWLEEEEVIVVAQPVGKGGSTAIVQSLG